ncbi:metallophosphoesterase [Petrotoga sp. 9PWA.NaAc.5.4]|uniref:metallophosphoesterase n=1 Tax=Petrotoga sp. 9PWA.NaAc.5.4 TaxID=1434328 RepID=UPI000CB1166E|nr:metallophosphoesterase [Petrotoga sp. 9PWA.NaAc.5.4]PNR94160.1 metallophosphatase [Petrotoga sp. 9PWA.NaAc.5.4]
MWLILSDSHDNMIKIKHIPNIVEENNVTAIFHCGDFVSPFTLPYFLFENIEFYGVFGNNDGEKILLHQKSNGKIKNGPVTIELENKKIFLMHEPYSLISAEKSGLYDYIFFGHTHEIVKRRFGKTLVLNPGELCGWLTSKATYALLDPITGEVEIKEL